MAFKYRDGWAMKDMRVEANIVEFHHAHVVFYKKVVKDSSLAIYEKIFVIAIQNQFVNNLMEVRDD